MDQSKTLSFQIFERFILLQCFSDAMFIFSFSHLFPRIYQQISTVFLFQILGYKFNKLYLSIFSFHPFDWVPSLPFWITLPVEPTGPLAFVITVRSLHSIRIQWFALRNCVILWKVEYLNYRFLNVLKQLAKSVKFLEKCMSVRNKFLSLRLLI